MYANGNDFQHAKFVQIINRRDQLPHPRGSDIYRSSLLQIAIYLAVRHCIEATWLNDRDQFLFPNDTWKADSEFHADCLAYTLFHGQNRISTAEGVNHWIPFTEAQVNAQEKFGSHFMSRYLAGNAPPTEPTGGGLADV